jgi:nucleotide-binding universal stress UspA family protein
MIRIARIVVGVDLDGDAVGQTARLAIEQACSVARAAGAHVTLVHSHRDDERWNHATRSFEPFHPPAGEAERHPLERAAAALRDDGISCDVVTSDEGPAIAIIHQVLREHADLAIVGKRAAVHHDSRRMGSVSLNVVRHCPCLVSVVKPESKASPKMIVAASDGGPVGVRVVEAAMATARLFGSELHVIHAIQLGMEIQMEGEEAERSFVHTRRTELKAQVDAVVGAAGFDGKVEVHAGVTTPTRAVLEAVERLEPDLVVMGTISRGGIPGLLVGNSAERLLGLLDCSLLVAKPEDFVCPVELD